MSNIIRIKSAAFEPDLVHAPNFCWIPIRNHEWRNVLNDLGAAAKDGMSADSAKLVHSAKSANDGVVLNDNVAGKSAIIREDYMISDQAVMGYMGVGEKVAVVADDSFCIRQSATVHRTELSEAVVITDFKKGRLADILQVLASLAERAVRIEAVVLPNLRRSGDGHMVHQHRLRADDNIRADYAIWTDFNVVGEFSPTIDDCRGMDHSEKAAPGKL